MVSFVQKMLFLLVVSSAMACMDQYKPFAFWQQLEDERNAAKANGENVSRSGDLKYLANDGRLVIEKKSDSDVDPRLTESADDIYSGLCAACHGANGEGVAAIGGRNFQDRVWQADATDEQIRLALLVGTAAVKSDYPEVYEKIKTRTNFDASKDYKGTMMPSGGRVPPLTDEQIDGMIVKIRSFSP